MRYYDEIGLVAPSERVGGKRRFLPDAVGRVNFIRRAQGVGFSLEEVADILDDSDGAWGRMVADKLTELRSQRKELDVMVTMLEWAHLDPASRQDQGHYLDPWVSDAWHLGLESPQEQDWRRSSSGRWRLEGSGQALVQPAPLV